ncbi:hypothetical protein TL18_03620 [Methanobrevibacter sp. YE315]|uniref:hypothetical protein n=1 Tax=Methanobrevibacter sp. YE315 TaxID=1609968 RepID=UPI000764D42F|nr:hypothetical protein [Methanobrevibacter sp. YE315]AMD17189.1 hypothetical protein TL18_03620 [Methanobrevibacter sp. YE315]
MNFRNIILIIISAFSSLLSIESFNEFLNDDGGGLVLPISGNAIDDEDWIEYKKLKVDESVKSINPKDLPSDFCDGACRLVDEFRRKTVNEDVEWLIYFDYRTGDVIYCWKGKMGESGGDLDIIQLNDRNLASVHNHTEGYYSVPSPENFDILENEFEDYEVITSKNSFWTVEFKGGIDKELRENFQLNLSIELDKIEKETKLQYGGVVMVRDMIECIFSDYLLTSIEKSIGGIPLILNKMEYE